MAAAGTEFFLGLDVGTQGTKALLVDARGRVLARATHGYGLIEGLPPGAAEQHPSTWIEAVRAVCAELWKQPDADPARVAAVGVSGQQHGCVLLDEQDAALRPAKLWCDTSTTEEARELAQSLGRHIPVGFTASKILWSARREPELWKRARLVLLPHDYVNFVLTGAATMEAGDASGTGFFDPVRRGFDLEAARAIDARLPELLPPLIEAGESAGRLVRAGAALTGLREGVLVSAGGGDNMCSAIGAGATRPGVAVLSLGTSATIFGYAAAPVVDPRGLIAPFCDSTGGWLPLLCVMNATAVLEELRECFGTSLDVLTREAEAVEPGCHGVLCLPYFSGERVPDLPQATGSFVGLRPGLARRGLLFRAALEGVALNLAWGLERMRALGFEARELRLVGGGAKNLLWRQVLADALAAVVLPLEETETGALGAALQARWSWRKQHERSLTAEEALSSLAPIPSARIEPDPVRARGYEETGRRFRERVRELHRT